MTTQAEFDKYFNELKEGADRQERELARHLGHFVIMWGESVLRLDESGGGSRVGLFGQRMYTLKDRATIEMEAERFREVLRAKPLDHDPGPVRAVTAEDALVEVTKRNADLFATIAKGRPAN